MAAARVRTFPQACMLLQKQEPPNHKPYACYMHNAGFMRLKVPHLIQLCGLRKGSLKESGKLHSAPQLQACSCEAYETTTGCCSPPILGNQPVHIITRTHRLTCRALIYGLSQVSEMDRIHEKPPPPSLPGASRVRAPAAPP